MSAATKVYSVFSETLGIPLASVTDQTSPENTPKWDSLRVMDLVLALETAFNVRFSTKEIISMRSVGLVRRVLVIKGVQGASMAAGTDTAFIAQLSGQAPLPNL